jgi:DNA-binding MarR family transcriptional regulator/GNAT superfamily N-acetyltransferase
VAAALAKPRASSPDVAAVRAFNRFYTQKIGVLSDAPLESGLSLAESRVLYELAHSDDATASALMRDLGLDQGYLSRILRRLEKDGLLKRTRSKADKRQSHIALTRQGRKTFARIDSAWQGATEALVAPLPRMRRRDLVTAMRQVEALLGGERTATPVTLRAPGIGDMGWLVHRHAVVYAQEYGWDDEFEALVAEILAAFIRNYDPACEQCWIAELAGAPVGSVFLVKESDEMGRLRLLFVEPSARGHGIGRLLVDACIDQARRVGYRKLTLWTNDVLASARRIYEAAGFRLVKEWRDRKFGQDLVGQDWELTL